MEAADDMSEFREHLPGESGAVVYVPCPSCGRPVRLPPPESDEPARCESCGATVEASPPDVDT
jgi:predicted RNA-binding Zn-ribbon protein involved in translation (DUF1610 family)